MGSDQILDQLHTIVSLVVRRAYLDEKSIRPQAHSDYVYQKINTYGHNIDIMIEAKRKELCSLNSRYLELHG